MAEALLIPDSPRPVGRVPTGTGRYVQYLQSLCHSLPVREYSYLLYRYGEISIPRLD